MRFYADLHIHSKYSRATSKDLNLESIYKWAQLKGLTVVGTSDFTHPAWFAEIKKKCIEAEQGLLALKAEYASKIDPEIPLSCRGSVRFLLSVEISTIYKKGDRVRKVHHLVIAPSIEIAERINKKLGSIGNIKSDGRPIFGMDSRDLLELLTSISEDIYLIPAHIWTPHFAVLGSRSGFDSIEECYRDMTPYIFALETGLSSDPKMNWQVSKLDKWALVSNSDAHSAEKLARECNYFDTDLSYPAMFDAIRAKDPEKFLRTIEFFPEEGKYHYDGHRNCNVCFDPKQTNKVNSICPVCNTPLVVGVCNRVEGLSDRSAKEGEKGKIPFEGVVPLKEILSQVHKVGPSSKRVNQVYHTLLNEFGPELYILRELPVQTLTSNNYGLLARAISRMRNAEIEVKPGYDGEYGVISLLKEEDFIQAQGQMTLF